jgi:hypothetical protein
MGAVTAAVVGAVGALGAAKMSSDSSKKAARAGNASAQSGLDLQRQQFDTFQQNIAPYLQAGEGALGGLNALAEGDYSAFEESPDYLYARDQMQQGIERGAAARGSLYSGGTNVDLGRQLGGLASQNLGNYRNSLFQLAGMGQNAAVGAGNLGQQSANAQSGLLAQQGQNNANAAIQQGNAWGNALQGIAGVAGQYAANRSSSYPNAQIGAVQRQPITPPVNRVQVPNVNFGGFG